MKIRSLLTNFIVSIVFLLSANVEPAENHNSSRSNRSYIAYNSGLITDSTAKTIQAEIDKQPQVTEQNVREILKKNGVKGINAVNVKRQGARWEILLLRNPQDESAARMSISTHGEEGLPSAK